MRQRVLTPQHFFSVAGAILLCAVVLSASQGSVELTFVDHLNFFSSLLGLNGWLQSVFDFPEINQESQLILANLRWPRIGLAMLVGACLAVSGAALQGLFRNPLADPALIGVSSGALLGVSVVTVFVALGVFSLGDWSQLATMGGAFIGALMTSWLVFTLAKKLATSSQQMILYLLLIGIAVSAFTAAGAGLSKYFLNVNELRQVTLWQLGNLQPPNHLLLIVLTVIVAVVVILFSRLHASLNILALGADQAKYLGVNLKRLQHQVVFLTALGVGLSVSMAGLIGFVGLVAPHCVRLLIGPDHRWLIPGSALMGAIMLVASDYLSRQIFSSEIIPVGIITAMVGAPWFLWVLLQARK